jgi:inosine/xanthosine triphosphatase
LNPIKIAAVRQAFETAFGTETIECIGQHAPSGVSDQPMDAEETRIGAENRVVYCRQKDEQADQRADYYVAMEGGVDKFTYGPATFAYVAIADRDQISIGRGAILPLPNKVYRELQSGKELGDVMDDLFNVVNIKQKGGAIALLTKGHATREGNYTEALLLALVPFLNQALFSDE